MLSVGLNEIRNREHRRHVRRLTAIAATAVAATIFASALTPSLRTFENTSRVTMRGMEITLSGELARLNWQVAAHYIVLAQGNNYIDGGDASTKTNK